MSSESVFGGQSIQLIDMEALATTHNGQPHPVCEPRVLGSFDERTINLGRLLLATTALLATLHGGTNSDEYLVVCATFALCAATVAASRAPRFANGGWRLSSHAYWFDVLFYTALVLFGTHDADAIFFGLLGYSFTAFAASAMSGSASGLRVGAVAALLFAFFAGLSLARSLLLSVALFLLCYVISRAVGYANSFKRRLELLRDVTRISNPRFGVDHTVGAVLNQLREFFDADACLIVTRETEGGADVCTMRRAIRAQGKNVEDTQQITSDAVGVLLSLPIEHTALYQSARRWSWFLNQGALMLAAPDGSRFHVTPEAERLAAAVAGALDAGSYISVPMRRRYNSVDRLYIISERAAAFTPCDAAFAAQVVGHVMPLIENIRLVDRLASDAAEEERRKIARDIHDSVIQPYIGIKLGLQAVRRKMVAGSSPEAIAQIDRLTDMVDDEIQDLRRYVGSLDKRGTPGTNLLPAMRRFAIKFSDATGIGVEVAADAEMRINDRLAAETFQLMSEGLSNIRRHTQARRACVDLTRRNGSLVLSIKNDGVPAAANPVFTPRSISERAAALGGRVKVECGSGDATVVEVEIPI